MSTQAQDRPQNRQTRKAISRLLAAVDKTVTAVDEIRAAKAELERLAGKGAAR